MNDWNILVIEDNADNQEVVCRMLKYHRIPYIVVDTGEEALHVLKQEPITACIVDLALPGIDGWSVLDAIRNDESLHALPCIAITAYHSAEVAVKAIEAGFNAYFSKPLDATSFVRELNGILAN